MVEENAAAFIARLWIVQYNPFVQKLSETTPMGGKVHLKI